LAEFSHITTRLSHVYERFGTAQHFLRAAAEQSGKKWYAGLGLGFFGKRRRSTHDDKQAKFKKTNDGETAYSTNQTFNFGLVTAIVTLQQSI
jgi:hypothetical protein